MNFGSKERELFLDQGYLHLSSLIDSTDCKRLIFRMRELSEKKCPSLTTHIFQAGEHDQTKDEFFLSSANKISFFFDKNAAVKNANSSSSFFALNKVGHALHNLCPVFSKFSHRPTFYDLALLLGHKKPLLIQSMFIFKQSKFGDEVPAHQDASFLYTEPNTTIGIWFALENADENNGCLWALKGGHRGKLKNRFLKHPDGLHFGFNLRVFWPKNKFVPLLAKAGDAIVLHGLLPHFSEQNRSNRTRFAYTIHFIDQRAYYPKTNWLDISSN